MSEKCLNPSKLKTFIQMKRQKKKQELVESALAQRQKREEEIKRFRVKMSLDELSAEMTRLETKLAELKQQKHQLFSQLKKVLNEDDMRRRHRDLQWTAQHAHNAALQQQQHAFDAPPTAASNQLFHPFQQQQQQQSRDVHFFHSNAPQMRPQFAQKFSQQLAPPPKQQLTQQQQPQPRKRTHVDNTPSSGGQTTYTPSFHVMSQQLAQQQQFARQNNNNSQKFY